MSAVKAVQNPSKRLPPAKAFKAFVPTRTIAKPFQGIGSLGVLEATRQPKNKLSTLFLSLWFSIYLSRIS
jgi:hypothetical protein